MRSRLTNAVVSELTRGRVFLAAVLALAAAPGVAVAATVEANSTGILYRAAPGEVNDVKMGDTGIPGRRSVEERSAPLTIGAGCEAGATLLCGLPGGARDVIILGDRDDRASYFTGATFSYVFGGTGDDDFLSGGGEAYGWGGRGDDNVRVSSNGGSHGYGGPGDDRIVGSGIFDLLYGEGGDDVLVQNGFAEAAAEGGPGDDRIELHAWTGGLKARGGRGNDTLTVVAERGGPWSLFGGPGNDVITGSAGPDTIVAGPGRDHIAAAERSADSPPDTLVCGPGYDRVSADPQDVVAADCEQVRLLAPLAAPEAP
jgi:RTX calcium-binding nonapeptide repeat (4 copies)